MFNGEVTVPTRRTAMTRHETLAAAARNAMTHVLDLVPEDRVLVLTDPETRTCGEAFARGATGLGCDVLLHCLPAEGRPLQAMPPAMADLLDERTVVVNAIVGDAREVGFRLEWLQLVEASPVIRMGHSPGIDADMMAMGPLNVDYAAMRTRADELCAFFADAVSVHVTAPGGTDLVLDLTGRVFVSDLKARPGVGCNLPCGEVFCCPVETGADGVLVVDACFGSWGNMTAPAVFTLERGRVVDVRSDDAAALAEIHRLLDTDDGARTIAELGIGLNPGARLTDRMLEAEKVAGTAHIAFGTNEGMPGGQSRSKVHIDYLFREPRFAVTDARGARRTSP
jgi:leucyl aminopeptidase (aminopeptidase T)